MDTNETIQTQFYLDQEIIEDFSAKQNITLLVFNRVQKLGSDLDGKHFYSLTITKTPSRINYFRFSFEDLQEISRKLTNGLSTFGCIPNRKFWNRYFIGGVRTISIKQDKQKEYPSFKLNYLVYSKDDNLDVRIKNQLLTRLKMIDSSLEVSFTYLGTYSDTLIQENLDFSTEVDFYSPTITKLGEDTIQHIFNNQFQRPRFFGKLFKPNLPLEK